MIRLIASDLDGTLMEEGGRFLYQEDYNQILRELTEEFNILFVPASGRSSDAIESMFPTVERKVVLSDNGAVISRENQVISSEVLDPLRLMLFLEELENIGPNDLHLMFRERSRTSVLQTDPSFYQMIRCGVDPQAVFLDGPEHLSQDVIRVTLYDDKGARAIYDRIDPKWKNEFRILISGNCWMDVISKNCSKGLALRKIQDMSQISREETMVFGDSFNDLSMFEQAKISYASQSSPEPVRDRADRTFRPWQEKGVLQELHRLKDELSSFGHQH